MEVTNTAMEGKVGIITCELVTIVATALSISEWVMNLTTKDTSE